MNIIELVKTILIEFPKISEVCNDIHVDFTEDKPTNYGLSSTGDALIKEDILGNQKRKHNFILYAVFQSLNDYDRINNSGVLLELQMWLERHAVNQTVTIDIGDEILEGKLERLTCANGMLYNIPEGNETEGVQYQLQIFAEYTIEI